LKLNRIETELIKAVKELIISIWNIFNSPNNDPVIAGLIIGLVAVLWANISMFRNFKARLKDKDDHITDLVSERNKLQDYFFKHMDMERKSTKKGQTK